MSETARTALVTGAARRLGLYLTEQLLEDGWRVFALSRQSSPELDALQRETLRIIRAGSYELSALQQAMAAIQETADSLDLMVHNASMFEKDQFEKEREAGEDVAGFLDRLYQVHMRMPVILNEGLRDLLHRGEGACVVNVTDIYAENPNPDYGLYCSTKAGLENLTKSYARKWAPKVRVNSIQPGPIRFLPGEQNAQERKTILAETPMGSEGGFYPIYQGLRFIIENAYLTGSAIKIDGGRSIGQG